MSSDRIFLTCVLLVATACSQPRTSAWISRASSAVVRPAIGLSPATPVAVDPELSGFDGWPLAFWVAVAPTGSSCGIEISRDGAQLASLTGTMGPGWCDATWPGRAAGGTRLEDGPVTVTATLFDAAHAAVATTTAELALVRVGVTRIDLGGAIDARQPLMYRAMGGQPDGFFELTTTHTPFAMGPDSTEAGATALAHASGAPRPIPTIWEDLLSPPLDRGAPQGVNASYYSLPSAFVVGSEIDVTARTSTSAAIPSGIELRLVAPVDLAIQGDDAVHDGATIQLSTVGSPVVAVDRYDLSWAFTFEARPVGGEWQPMPGTFTVPLRIYGLAGVPVFDYRSLPHRTWVDVIDRITGWIQGTATNPEETANALVQHVYEETNLRYDTASGASFYTEYPGVGFEGAVFYMQDFEARTNGRIVNCSDAASILSSYGSMAGIDLRYHILTSRIDPRAGFDLNYIRAIGMPGFDDTPFDGGGGGFSYHAIVSGPDRRTLDATLTLDGDANPASSPFAQLFAQSLDPTRYLTALSSEPRNIRTDLDEKVRIQ